MLRHTQGLALGLLCWLAAGAVMAQQAAPPAANAPLTLDTDVQVPEGLWQEGPGQQKPRLMPVPSAAETPPEPLSPPPSKALTIMLDWFLSPQHAPLLLAKARGLYQEQGLEVTLKPPADPSLPARLLKAGEVDAALARQPLLHLSNHDNAGLVRIATLIEAPLNAVIVTGEFVPGELDSLAGRAYGYTTREGAELIAPLLVPDTVQQTDTYQPPENVYYNARRTLKESDIEVIADGFPAYLPARLNTDGIKADVVHYDELGMPSHDGLILMVKGSRLTRHKKTWQHLVIAIEQATRWIVANPDEAWEALIEAYPVLDNSVNADAWPTMVRRMTLRPAAVDHRRYQRMEAFLERRGVSKAPLPVNVLAVDPHAL